MISVDDDETMLSLLMSSSGFMFPRDSRPVRCSYDCADQQQLNKSQHWTADRGYICITASSFTLVFLLQFRGLDSLMVFCVCSCSLDVILGNRASVCDVWTCPAPVSAALDSRDGCFQNARYVMHSKSWQWLEVTSYFYHTTFEKDTQQDFAWKAQHKSSLKIRAVLF